MIKINDKIKSKILEVVVLNLVAGLDESEISLGCSKNTKKRLCRYSKEKETVPPLWNNEESTFAGVKVVEIEPFEENILVVSPTCKKIVWLED